MVNITIPAVALAALIPMAIGMLWYSPLLFMKPWLKAMGWTPEEIEEKKKKGMTLAFTGSFAAAIIQAIGLAVFTSLLGTDSFASGAWNGLWIGICFAAASSLSGALFEHRSLVGWFINAAYSVTCLVLMGGILGAWR